MSLTDLKYYQRPHVLDATRERDNLLVCLKKIERDSREVEIARFLTAFEDSDNHCVPLLEVIPDEDPTSNVSFLVTPYLRPMNNPPFFAVAEVLDCIQQTLEVCSTLTCF